MKNNQKGFIEVLGAMFVLALIVGFIFAVFCVRFKLSDERVSGIVYNTTNNRAISGATCFYVRAGVDTYVNENNQSSYCLPKGSKYISLVNQAAENKDIKVVVIAHKYGPIVKAPWAVYPNVTVTKVKN